MIAGERHWLELETTTASAPTASSRMAFHFRQKKIALSFCLIPLLRSGSSFCSVHLYSSCVRPLTSQGKESRRQRAGPAPPAMTLDESFKRPGTVPFKWEVQPGIPKQQGAAGDVPPPPTSPRLALPPAARVAAPLATPHPQPSHSHRRSMSARFVTSLALMPFVTRRGRGGGGGRNCEDEFCLLYGDKAA